MILPRTPAGHFPFLAAGGGRGRGKLPPRASGGRTILELPGPALYHSHMHTVLDLRKTSYQGHPFRGEGVPTVVSASGCDWELGVSGAVGIVVEDDRIAANPINRTDANGTDSGSVQPPLAGKQNYYHGEFAGIILTPYGTDTKLLPTFEQLLKGIDLVDQLKNMGDVIGAIAQGYGEAEALDSVARNIAVHAGGEIIKQKTDSTFDVKDAIPSVVNKFIKSHECTHGFSLWIHVKYDSIEQSTRGPIEWLFGVPPIYAWVSHDDYIQCKIGSDPTDDTGHYGQTGSGFYMPTPAQMKQMIEQAIEARGGTPPKYINQPDPQTAGVGGG